MFVSGRLIIWYKNQDKQEPANLPYAQRNYYFGNYISKQEKKSNLPMHHHKKVYKIQLYKLQQTIPYFVQIQLSVSRWGLKISNEKFQKQAGS